MPDISRFVGLHYGSVSRHQCPTLSLFIRIIKARDLLADILQAQRDYRGRQ